MKNKTTDSALKRNSTTIADVDLYIDGFEIPKNKERTKQKYQQNLYKTKN